MAPSLTPAEPGRPIGQARPLPVASPGRSPPAGMPAANPASGLDNQVATLYAAHFERLVALAARLLGDADEAEDVAQEALVAACLALRRGSLLAQPAAWLTRVARNLAISRLRQRQDRARLQARLGEAIWPIPGRAAGGSDPAALVADAEGVRQIAAALAELPARRRDDLYLHLRCPTAAAAAGALGLTEAAWRARLGRAREALRLALRRQDRSDHVPPLPVGARRIAVAELHAQGQGPAAIAGILGLTRSTVTSDLAFLRRHQLPVVIAYRQLSLLAEVTVPAGNSPGARRTPLHRRVHRRRCRRQGQGTLPLWPLDDAHTCAR